MKEREIENDKQRDNTFEAMRGITYPYVVSVSRERQRTKPQNSRYWVMMQDHLDQIAECIEAAVDHTGHTALEIRTLVGIELPTQQAVILFTLRKKSAHEVLKTICGVPTSVRLGTKQFKKFEGIMEMTMSEIVGAIRAVTGSMMS